MERKYLKDRKKRNILAIGDPINSTISYRERLFGHSTFLAKNGVCLSKVDYSDAEKREIPDMDSEEILAILFFPQRFRDKNIDSWIKKDRIFGGNTQLNEIDNYYSEIGENLCEKYGERLKFLNSPDAIKHSRDKRKIKKVLMRAEIPTPNPIYLSDVNELLEFSFNKGIFIKLPGWGYGQGITSLKKGECMTNFNWDGAEINLDYESVLKHPVKITKPKSFLEKLLEVDPLIEEEVNFKKINGKKFDLRMYVVGNPYSPAKTKVPFWFPRSNDPKELITNWAMGGEIRYDSYFRQQIPKEAIDNAIKNVLRLSKELNLFYGGVDIMFEKNWNPLIIEAQTDCGLPNPEQFDLLLYIAQKLIEN